MNKTDYLNEGERPLAYEAFYRKLTDDPTLRFAAEVVDTQRSLLREGKRTDPMYAAMLPQNSKPVYFYLLPHIHKDNNPGRPIGSSNGAATEKISSFVDHLIKDIPQTFPSYLKDTGHFLREISRPDVPTGRFVVTVDDTSLYTNIPHSDRIFAAVSQNGDNNICLGVTLAH